jgi:hypothetical protein
MPTNCGLSPSKKVSAQQIEVVAALKIHAVLKIRSLAAATPPQSRYHEPKTVQRVTSYQRLWLGKSIASARCFLPIGDNSNWDQNAPRLKQTCRGSDNLLPHPIEKTNLRGQLACDTITDAQDIHGPTSLLHLINH